MKTVSIFLICCLFSLSALAKGTYQKPSKFIENAFDGQPPAPQIYEYNEVDTSVIANIKAKKVSQGRTRYWQQGNKTAWVLKHIGKTKPITAGFIVEDGKITKTKVLIFKETRGWEVRFKYFTKQFTDATLAEDHKLDRRIDNVSGATLSVRAMKKMARVALYLHQQVTDNAGQDEEAPTTP